MMKLHVKYDTLVLYRALIREKLDKLGYSFSLEGQGQLYFNQYLSTAQLNEVNDILKPYGIQVLDDPQMMFAQKVREFIVELVHQPELMENNKFSDVLARKLNHSYSYISKIFSDVNFMSIEQFIILQKIERVKHLLSGGTLTLTEIAWQLNYSSVQHLSNQFRKTTGITPSSFQKIVKERRKHVETRKIDA